MSSGTDSAIEVLGEALTAYKRRVAELELIVQQQQTIIQELKGQPPAKESEVATQ